CRPRPRPRGRPESRPFHRRGRGRAWLLVHSSQLRWSRNWTDPDPPISCGPRWARARPEVPMRRAAALVLALLWPAASSAETSLRSAVETRPLRDGFLYLGSAPGVNMGGSALPRSLYFDLVRGGYVFQSGFEINAALSGTNMFPGEGEYSVSMARL